MGQIEDLRIFVDVVNSGGIGRAADAQNIAKSAVSRRIKLIEERYGVQLIDRRPGLWDITEAGQELYQRALRVLVEADEIETDFTHARQSLAGPLSVSVPREFGLAFLEPILLRFIADHPDIQLTVDFDDRRVDLDRENYDFAIRIAQDVEPELTSKHLGCAHHWLCASVDYAKTKPLPETLDALTQHPLLHFGFARCASWDFLTGSGNKRVDFQPAINSNSGHFLREAVRNGRGIARLPDFIAQSSHARGELVHVLPDYRLRDSEIVLAYSKSRLLNRRMRVFIEQISLACANL